MLYISTVIFDMIRVRERGVVVPRFQIGRQRAVRGRLNVGDEYQPELRRHLRRATLQLQGHGQAPEPLWDVQLVHASGEMLVLGGFERIDDAFRVIEYAQTWVLCAPRDGVAEGSYGPPYPR